MQSAEAFETRTYHKVDIPLIPFLFLCYMLAYPDRVNVGFAKLRMLIRTDVPQLFFMIPVRHRFHCSPRKLPSSTQDCSLPQSPLVH